MALFWRATRRLIPVNFNKGGNNPRLMIVHIMQGTLVGTDSWFHNPASQVSAHFGVGTDGVIYQWVNTDDIAWHAMEANDHSIGVENEGNSGDKLTTRQLEANARILHWVNLKHNAVNLWLTKRPATGSGLAWHGLGGAAWGNHPDCPGTPIVDQLPAILNQARLL
jgi:hypothetical protein